MNKMEKLSGRELDAAVAERVMNIMCNCERTPDGSKWCRRHGTDERVGAPFYSSSIEAAMMVVEKLRSQGYQFVLSNRLNNQIWQVDLSLWEDGVNYTTKRWQAFADTLPLAICRVALTARSTTP